MYNGSCLKMMKDVSSMFRKNVDDALKEENITTTQMSRLLTLRDEFDGKSDFKSMEKALGVAQSSAATLFSRLESKGFIEAYTDSSDRRVKKMNLTEEGILLCRKIEKTVYMFAENAVSGITREEMAILENVLGRVYMNVTNDRKATDGGAVNA